MLLGLFTSAIQALIFATLAAFYIGEGLARSALVDSRPFPKARLLENSARRSDHGTFRAHFLLETVSLRRVI